MLLLYNITKRDHLEIAYASSLTYSNFYKLNKEMSVVKLYYKNTLETPNYTTSLND